MHAHSAFLSYFFWTSRSKPLHANRAAHPINHVAHSLIAKKNAGRAVRRPRRGDSPGRQVRAARPVSGCLRVSKAVVGRAVNGLFRLDRMMEEALAMLASPGAPLRRTGGRPGLGAPHADCQGVPAATASLKNHDDGGEICRSSAPSSRARRARARVAATTCGPALSSDLASSPRGEWLASDDGALRRACAAAAAALALLSAGAGPALAVSGGSLGLGESGLPISNK